MARLSVGGKAEKGGGDELQATAICQVSPHCGAPHLLPPSPLSQGKTGVVAATLGLGGCAGKNMAQGGRAAAPGHTQLGSQLPAHGLYTTGLPPPPVPRQLPWATKDSPFPTFLVQTRPLSGATRQDLPPINPVLTRRAGGFLMAGTGTPSCEIPAAHPGQAPTARAGPQLYRLLGQATPPSLFRTLFSAAKQTSDP